jgi:hypothetical protein
MNNIVLRDLPSIDNSMIYLSEDLQVVKKICGGLFDSNNSTTIINNVLTTLNSSIVIGVANGPTTIIQTINAPR